VAVENVPISRRSLRVSMSCGLSKAVGRFASKSLPVVAPQSSIWKTAVRDNGGIRMKIGNQPYSKPLFETITITLSYRQSDLFVLLSPVKLALQFEIQHENPRCEKRRHEKRQYQKRFSGCSSPTTNFPAPVSCSHLASPSRVAVGPQFHAGSRHISPIPARTERNSRELSSIVSCKYKCLFAQRPCFDTDANAWGVWPNRLLKFFRMCPLRRSGRNSRW